jgi:hypothetical protein
MWMVNPEWMCRQHLLGEHVETHMFFGSLMKLKDVSGFIDKGLLEFKSLNKRHDQLAAEISRRGYTHASPMGVLKNFTPSNKISHSIVDRVKSEQELLSRCPECTANYAKLKKKD